MWVHDRGEISDPHYAFEVADRFAVPALQQPQDPTLEEVPHGVAVGIEPGLEVGAIGGPVETPGLSRPPGKASTVAGPSVNRRAFSSLSEVTLAPSSMWSVR